MQFAKLKRVCKSTDQFLSHFAKSIAGVCFFHTEVIVTEVTGTRVTLITAPAVVVESSVQHEGLVDERCESHP